MSVRLFFDTETTGLVKRYSPLDFQPHPVQVAFLLKEGSRVYASGNFIVNTEGIEVPEKVAAIHGITTDMLALFGVPATLVADIFMAAVLQADELVAHNIDFDLIIMAAMLFRQGKDYQALQKKPRICTMHSTTAICQLPGNFGYKWPKLIEAYKHLVDPAGFEGAHDALADVKACAAILDVLEEKGHKLESGDPFKRSS